MKKLLLIFLIFGLTVVFAGCSSLPGSDPLNEQDTGKSVDQLFDYTKVDYQPGEILVKSGVSLEGLVAKEGSYIIKEWPETGWSLVKVPEGEDTLSFIKKMQKKEGVLLAEPNMLYELHMAPSSSIRYYDKQWGFENIKAEAAWDITIGDPNVIVAIVDTGVDIAHPEFADKTFIGAFDATGEGYDGELMYDINGHGTHVAGIAADSGHSGKIAGVAWENPIMPIRVMDEFEYIYTYYLMNAMYYLGDFAAAHPEYRIVANMSIGGRGYSFAFKDAIDYAADNGVLLITSAGNDQKRVLSYPSAYNGVVSVAASDPDDEKAEFSTTGYWNSVAAPGVGILSTYPTLYSESGYEYLQGTSMASPFVTGAAALLLSSNPSLTPIQIKNQLEQTANGDGYTEELGYGVIDMEAMLGPLAPMQYGAIEVTTNIDSSTDYVGAGVITIHDANGLLIAHGTTGINGNHQFDALKPGSYTVNLTLYNDFKSASVVVTEDSISIVDFQVYIPQLVVVDEVAIDTTDYYFEKTYTLDAGDYHIYTEENTDPYVDTVLYLYDSTGNLIASNDDSNGLYSSLELNLEAGTYTVRVEEYGGEGFPLNCMLYVTVFQ